MNRSFISVIAAFGTDGSSTGDDQEAGEHREITAEETAEMLKTPTPSLLRRGTGWRWRRRSIRGGNHRKLRTRYQRAFSAFIRWRVTLSRGI